MADNVAVVFSAQIGQLIEGVAEVKKAILSIAEPIASLTETFGVLGEAMAAAFAVREIDEFFSHFAELATQTQRNATLLGTATEQVGGLDIAAKASGGSLEGLVSSMERLGMALATAGGGSAKAKAGLEALGISVKEFRSLTPEQQLETLADKFSVLKDGIDKDAIAMAIMGRAGAQMIPIFNEGAHSLEEFQEMAKRTGTALGAETVAGFVATHHSLIELSKSFEGVGVSVASIFKPAFDGIVRILIDVVQGFNNSIREGGSMKVILEVLAVAAKGIVTALALAIAVVETFWSVGKLVVLQLANDWVALGKIMYGAFTFDMPAIKAAWSDLMVANRQVTLNAAGEIKTSMTNLMHEMTTIWGAGAEAHVKIEQTKTARLNILNKDNVASELAAAQAKIKIADMEYAQTAEKLNSQYKQMQITESQKTQALLAALEVRHAAEMAAIGEELAVENQSKAQHQKILNEKLQLDQKYAQDKQKIVNQAAEAEAKTWKSGADQVAGAFNGQLKSLLSGQQTFGQAMKAMSADLAMKLIQDVNKWVIEWIAAQLRTAVMGTAVKTADVATTAATETAKTTAVVAGSSARAAAETTSASVGIFAQIGNAFAVITADAAKTFAGVFAFLAPSMGPAAAGPAAASSAAVEASAAAVAVPGLAVGTDMILSPGLAMLHAGEQVVPAGHTGPYTGANNGGGGASLSFNLSAFNPQGLQALIKQMTPQLSRSLMSYQNMNPSLMGS